MKRALLALVLCAPLMACDDDGGTPTYVRGPDGQQLTLTWGQAGSGARVTSSDGRTGKATIKWELIAVTLSLLSVAYVGVRV